MFETYIVRTLASSTPIEMIYIVFVSTPLESAMHWKNFYKISHQHQRDIFYTTCGDQNLNSVGIVGTVGKQLTLWGHQTKRFLMFFRGVERMQLTPTQTNQLDRHVSKNDKETGMCEKAKEFPLSKSWALFLRNVLPFNSATDSQGHVINNMWSRLTFYNKINVHKNAE